MPCFSAGLDQLFAAHSLPEAMIHIGDIELQVIVVRAALGHGTGFSRKDRVATIGGGAPMGLRSA
jgi:hypothetical protein